MMQKVQRWSQPFCTCTKARALPSMASTRWPAVSLTDMMSLTRAFSKQVDAEIRQRAIGMRRELFLIAEHEVDLVHGDEIVRLGLRGAAGHDDARIGVFAPRLADRLLCLAHRLAGDGAGVEDDRAILERAETGALGLAAHHFRLIGIEPATEGDDLDSHQGMLDGEATL